MLRALQIVFVSMIAVTARGQDAWDYNFGCTMDPSGSTSVSAIEVVPGELFGFGQSSEVLVVGGIFATVGNGLVVNGLGAWTGTEWAQLDPAFLGFVGPLGTRPADVIFWEDHLYIAGNFDGVELDDGNGGSVFVVADGLVRYDGQTWEKLDTGFPSGNVEGSVFAIHQQELYIAGAYNESFAAQVYRLDNVGGQDTWVRTGGRSLTFPRALESVGPD